MLRLVKPTVAKVAKDMAFLKSLNKANQPNPYAGVHFMPFDYFMQPQIVDKGTAKEGIAMFPGTMSEEEFAKAVKETEKYQQSLLEKYDEFNQ